MEKIYETRESWLEAAVLELRPFMEARGLDVPGNIRVSCGWPGGSNISRTIGQCWDSECSGDHQFEIFISPTLSDPMDPQGVLSTLLHEMVHTVVGIDEKHGPNFKKAAKDVGLEGRMTSTNASEDTLEHLKPISDALGPYPHAKLTPKLKEKKPRKKTIEKYVCTDCEYSIRIPVRFIDVAIPVCPVCSIEFVHYES